jgi:hypothetical protein
VNDASECKALAPVETGGPRGRAGDQAMRWYFEFFAVTIDNKNTRVAYFRTCLRFFA